jgi:hypothetical protein
VSEIAPPNSANQRKVLANRPNSHRMDRDRKAKSPDNLSPAGRGRSGYFPAPSELLSGG